MDVTDDILISITTLPKLEKLCIDHLTSITDLSLTHLSQHLKILRCVGCQITDAGLAVILDKSQNIELLELSYCWNIANKAIRYAIDRTKGRANDVVLNIYLYSTYIEVWNIKEWSPFLELHEVPTKDDIKELNCPIARSYNDCTVYFPVISEVNFHQKDFFCKIDSCMYIKE